LKQEYSFTIIFVLIVGIASSFGFVSATPAGVYVDTLVFSIIAQNDEQVLALLDDDIDLIGNMIDPSFLQALTEAEDIEVVNVLRNGYGYFTINCDRYPLNITAFRRAFSFALDKQAISDEVWHGLSVPQDSVVPQVNPFSIEGQLPYTYYEANIAEGQTLLAAAGFADGDEDGILEAPNGEAFDIMVECASTSPIAIEVGQIAAGALTALGINATCVPTNFYEYLDRLNNHGDYDIAFFGTNFNGFDVDWLAYEYWSEYADEPYYNYPNFRNASYDAWRDQLLHATVYEDVYEAAIEMQRIFVHESPIVVCYENILLSAYRTDRFEGHINAPSIGVPNWWTFYNVDQSSAGGTFRTSLKLDVDSFNFMVSSSHCSELVNMEMWDSLIRVGPSGDDVLWLAESYIAETHADNPAVPAGHTRFTFDIVQNATWTDGTALTAEDAVFSFNYYRDAPGNPYGVDLIEMTAAYAPTPYTVIAEFNSESYWHLHTIGYKPIIPKHIFEVIGVDGWNTWNPNPPTEPMVTSGPFNVSAYVPGEFIEMTRNPNYFHAIPVSQIHGPSIVPQSDITYGFGVTGNQISWPVSDSNPDTYSIYRDSVEIETGPWISGNIVIGIDGLDMGQYNYTLEVHDTDGYSAVDTVLVNVITPRDGKIIFDYSHGQYSASIAYLDRYLMNNLTVLGYEVVCAFGGINSSILSDASGLVISSIYGTDNGFSALEIDDIANWFNDAPRFLWIGYDSDYGGHYINDNMTAILSRVNSHVYGEPTGIEDAFENAGAGYRVLANTTSNDPFVSRIVSGVDHVLMHDPTCLYGSTSANSTNGIVSLEDTSIENVYPLLYYGQGATIVDGDLIPPLAHIDGQIGGFAAAAMEINAGLDGNGIIITSGASPYGDYRPMYGFFYYDRVLTGNLFVRNAIDFGMTRVLDTSAPVIDAPEDLIYSEGDMGNYIDWSASDLTPSSYSIYFEEVLLYAGLWNSSSEILSINVDGLTLGIYNYTIVFEDSIGYSSTDTVYVEVVDGTSPVLTHPNGLTYSEGSTGHTISWQGTENYPSHYEVFKNGSIYRSGPWNSSGEMISVSVDGLSLGTYNYTLVLTDDGGNFASDTVFITVIDTTAPEYNLLPDDFSFNEGETGFSIIWNFTDSNPAQYVLYMNGSMVDSGTWTNPYSYEYAISVTAYGVHNFTIVVNDTAGLSASDTMWVAINDVTPPSLNNPVDISFQVGETGYVVNWTPFDNNPLTYSITRNGTVIISGQWTSGDSLVVNLDGLTHGTFLFTIVVYDQSGNFAMDAVVVRVLETSTTTTTTTTTAFELGDIMTIISFIVTIGSFVVIVVLVILIIRARK
jgi:ABC-type transport system substrate-binding protein